MTLSPAGRPVPILLYHSVTATPHPAIAGFEVTPAAFARHLDLVVDEGCTAMTVRGYLRALDTPGALPEKPVVITFDDGWADFAGAAAALESRRLPATLYVTTGLLGGRSGDGTVLGVDGRHGLRWTELRHLAGAGIEMGAHTHTHAQLDTLPAARVRHEVLASRHLLESELQTPVETFAYPHGYSSGRVRRVVREAGFLGACGVKNALSSTTDDRWSLARLTVRPTTTPEQLLGWLRGEGAVVAPPTERARTVAWRGYRRSRATLGRMGAALVPASQP